MGARGSDAISYPFFLNYAHNEYKTAGDGDGMNSNGVTFGVTCNSASTQCQ